MKEGLPTPWMPGKQVGSSNPALVGSTAASVEA